MIELTEGFQMRTNASVSLKTEKPNIIPYGQEKKMTENECEIEELQLEIKKQKELIKKCIELGENNEEKIRTINEKTNQKVKKLKDYLNRREYQLKKMNDAQRNTNEAVENKLKEEVNKLQVNNWKILMQNADYPMLEVIDENTVRIEGVKYQKVDEVKPLPKPPTLSKIIFECMESYNNTVQVPVIENVVDRVEVEWLPTKVEYCGDYGEGWNDCIDELKNKLRKSK